jgi:hypothetical protein
MCARICVWGGGCTVAAVPLTWPFSMYMLITSTPANAVLTFQPMSTVRCSTAA